MIRWHGLVALLDTPTGDGRRLRRAGPWHLREGAPLVHEHEPVGTVDSLLIVPEGLTATGQLVDESLAPALASRRLVPQIELDNTLVEVENTGSLVIATFQEGSVTQIVLSDQPTWNGLYITPTSLPGLDGQAVDPSLPRG